MKLDHIAEAALSHLTAGGALLASLLLVASLAAPFVLL